MFEALLQFIKELLFRNTTLDIRDKKFNLLPILGKSFIILSFALNYYLIGRFIKLAERHYELETAIVQLQSKHPVCTIDFISIDKN